MNTSFKLVLQGPGADESHARTDCRAGAAGIDHGARCARAALRRLRFHARLQADVDAAAHAAGIDATFIAAGRTLADFGLVAMDMDSTLITIECIDEIADMQGLKPQVSAITEAAMRGELDFAKSLTRRVGLLAGLPTAALARVYDERLRISPGGEAMLRAVQAAGLKTLLVSGGFTFFTERLQTRLGLDYAHANVLEEADGKLTGRVVGGIVDAAEKLRTVSACAPDLGIDSSQAIVMGDGANDLQMMGVAGLSLAFRAKPVVRAQADIALNFQRPGRPARDPGLIRRKPPAAGMRCRRRGGDVECLRGPHRPDRSTSWIRKSQVPQRPAAAPFCRERPRCRPRWRCRGSARRRTPGALPGARRRPARRLRPPPSSSATRRSG